MAKRVRRQQAVRIEPQEQKTPLWQIILGFLGFVSFILTLPYVKLLLPY